MFDFSSYTNLLLVSGSKYLFSLLDGSTCRYILEMFHGSFTQSWKSKRALHENHDGRLTIRFLKVTLFLSDDELFRREFITFESRTSGIFSINTVLIETTIYSEKNLCSGLILFPDLLCSCGLHSDQTIELLDSILEILSWQYDDHLISMTSCATSLKSSFSLFILIVVLFYSFAFHQIV